MNTNTPTKRRRENLKAYLDQEAKSKAEEQERFDRIQQERDAKLAEIKAKKTFTLSDLIDPDMLVEWLSRDGNPPMVWACGSKRSPFGSYGASSLMVPTPKQLQPLSRDNVDGWMRDHRAGLAVEWSKSAEYRKIHQTFGQWMGECLKATGIKAGGSIKDRLQRAILKHPELYTDAATVKANEAKELETYNEWLAGEKAKLADVPAA